MSEREKILGRIREALQVKATLPGSHCNSGTGGPPVRLTTAALHVDQKLTGETPVPLLPCEPGRGAFTCKASRMRPRIFSRSLISCSSTNP